MASSKPRLTDRQAAVLASVERLGRPIMADPWQQFPGLTPSTIEEDPRLMVIATAVESAGLPSLYAELLRDERLEPLFRKIQSKTELTYEEARAIVELAGRVPRYVAMPLPEWAEEVDGFFEWEPGTPDPEWASEHELQMRIATTRSLWKQLGFKRAPEIEVWSADRTCRYDLVGFDERIVVEVKLAGDLAALEEMDRYLETLRREQGKGDWREHIVVAKTADSALRRAVRQRPDVTLWKCERGTRTTKLVELD